MKKDLLKLLDLTGEEILKILDTADQLKFSQKHGIPHDKLKGKTLAMIFEKNSTRTRVSFETGMYQLGGHALFLSSKESQIGRGEPVEDTARVLLRYCDGIMIRTFAQEEVETLAAHANIPRHQRPHRLLPPLPGAGRPDDRPGAQGGAGGSEDVLHRRRQQHGQLPHRGRPEGGHGGVRGLPRGLRPPSGRAGLCPERPQHAI